MVNVDLSSSICEGHVVVALRGDLDLADAASVMAAMTGCVAPGEYLIVDLAALKFIDCAGLRALRGVRRLAQQQRGDVLLAAPQQIVLRVLTLTGTASLFRIHDSVATAVASARESKRRAAYRPAVTTARPATPARAGAGIG